MVLICGKLIRKVIRVYNSLTFRLYSTNAGCQVWQGTSHFLLPRTYEYYTDPVETLPIQVVIAPLSMPGRGCIQYCPVEEEVGQIELRSSGTPQIYATALGYSEWEN